MITLVEGANRQKTPNEIALTILFAVLTIVFIPVVVTLVPFGNFAGASVSVVILVSLLVCLIPTTIGALLSAIGIAGMDRLVQRNVLAMSGRAVEAAGDVQVLLLDKTGTITLGQPHGRELLPGRRTHRGRTGRRGPVGLTRRRDAGRSFGRRARQGSSSAFGSANSAPTTFSCPSRRRPGCRDSTSGRARSERVPRTP